MAQLSARAARDGSIVVLSPHPDDESLGCGGTVRLLTTAGVRVEVVYLTRGELGGEDPAALSADAQAQLARRRTVEAMDAFTATYDVTFGTTPAAACPPETFGRLLFAMLTDARRRMLEIEGTTDGVTEAGVEVLAMAAPSGRRRRYTVRHWARFDPATPGAPRDPAARLRAYLAEALGVPQDDDAWSITAVAVRAG